MKVNLPEVRVQVWFQNRRAKWRRQEKLESQNALRTLGHVSGDFHSPGRPQSPIANSPTIAPTASSQLPLDPWALSIGPSLGLPGFLNRHPSVYPSYLTPAAPAALPPEMPHSPVNLSLGPPEAKGDDMDPRSSSIVSLRMKAKEHVEYLHKGLAMI